MAAKADKYIREVVKRYIEELEKNRIHILEAVIFGSHAKGTAKEESDIDLALISEAFTGDRFEDRRKIVPLRRKIDSRVEPMPFKPEDFNNGGTFDRTDQKNGRRDTQEERMKPSVQKIFDTLSKWQENKENRGLI